MKFIPILFSTPMVQAILEGRKTQTRRVIKSRHDSGLFQICRRITDGQITSINSLDWDERNCEKDIVCPYGQPGDILWVRETFRPIEQDFGSPRYEYKATESINLSDKWKPSLFMPKSACRIFLKVKSVRVERLQDISEDDAIAEGIEVMKVYVHKVFRNYQDEAKTNGGYKGFVETAIASFKSLWQSINGEQSWKENPFVWVIEFERIEKPENFI